jgi:hypothetical protein
MTVCPGATLIGFVGVAGARRGVLGFGVERVGLGVVGLAGPTDTVVDLVGGAELRAAECSHAVRLAASPTTATVMTAVNARRGLIRPP